MKRTTVTTFIAAALAALAIAPTAVAEPQLLTQFCKAGSIGECAEPQGIAANRDTGHLYVADGKRVQEFTAWGEFVRAWGGGVVSGGAEGTGVLVPGSTHVTAVETTSKAFLRGMPIEGVGIAPGTRVAAVEPNSLLLSKAATSAATGGPSTIQSPEAQANVPVNELQRLTVTATSGTFNLLFEESGPSLGTETTTADIPYNASAAEVQAALQGLPAVGAGNVAVTSGNTGGGAGVPGGPYTIEFKGTRWADTNVKGPRVAAGAPPLAGGKAQVEPVRQGASAPEVCTGVDCVAGVDGNRAGQFAAAGGITVDSNGDVYVYERLSFLGGIVPEEEFNFGSRSNNRVQKFSPDGEFLLMFGKDVNLGGGSPSNPGDVCTAEDIANGDVCSGGSIGGGDGEFGLGPASNFSLETGFPIAAGPGDDIYVGGNERIQKFDSGGHFLASVPLPGESVSDLAADVFAKSPTVGDLFTTLYDPSRGGASVQVKADVHRLDPSTGVELSSYPIEYPTAVAVGSGGNVYAYQPDVSSSDSELVGFDAEGGQSFGLSPKDVNGSEGLAASNACGREGDGIFVSSLGVSASDARLPRLIDIYGPAPDPAVCPPPVQAPSIEAQFSTSVATTDASLRATINPHFWNDTRYRVQYGTGKCTEGDCDTEQPAAPGALLTSAVKDADIATPEVFLEGLEPATTYHYRFLAEGGGGQSAGEERSFRTLPLPGEENTACPNQAFRTGVAAKLPDCRGYEMVSPVDKNGGDIAIGEASFDQAAAGGGRFTFSSPNAFAGAPSAPLNNQYMATRGSGGWSTESITTPANSAGFYASGSTVSAVPYKAFDEALCTGWVIQGTNLTLSPEAPQRVPSLYRHDLCGEEGYEVLTSAQPPGFGFGEDNFVEYFPDLQAVSVDGRRAAFAANASLPTQAGDPRPALRCLGKTDEATFTWLRDGVPIPGAEADEYTPTAADEGAALQCRSTSSNEAGSAVATGKVMAIGPEVPRAPRPPKLTIGESAPVGATLTGTPEAGGTLTCTPGQWLNEPTIAYRWLRNGATIGGAEAADYTLAAADASAVVQCEVVATNAGGTAVGDSDPLLVAPDPPLARSAPTISGTPEVGQTLTCDPGSWSSSPTFAYRWLRNGAVIATGTGATSASRPVAAADAGKTLQCRVTAANADAEVVATSDRVVVPAAPATTPPQQSSPGSLSGAAEVGQTLTCDPGTWSGGPTFTYKWLRDGTLIAGVEASSYVLQAADEGTAVQCQVSAANAGGTTVAIEGSGKAVAYVLPDPPPAPVAEAFSYTVIEVYLHHEGGLSLVSVMPDGTASTERSSVGTFQAFSLGKAGENAVHHALSDDGTRVFWTAKAIATPTQEAVFDQPGHLYLRINATEPQSAVVAGQCTEPEKACTLPVSELVSPELARFLTADPAGTRALFTVEGKLYEYESDPTPQATEIAGGFLGLLGASEDTRQAYFASTEVLTGSEQNGEGDAALPGEPNVYRYEVGEGLTFVARLAKGDTETVGQYATAVNIRPTYSASRVSPDGGTLAFTAQSSPTGYDNADALSGQPAAEVYVYQAASGELTCASCNPSGARPRSLSVGIGNDRTIRYAALVPGWVSQTHPGNALSSDGRRLFFEAWDALVPGDTNGKGDVYQWEAVGKGDCTEASTSFSEANGGCVALISSGQSARDSKFFDATPSGSDVFFATSSSLVAQDNGLVDVYDARVGGGFPPPPPPAPSCEGEACQGTPAGPNDPTPASSSFRGAGNVVEGPPPRRPCPKGKVRRKGRCVKKHKHKSSKHQATRHAKAGHAGADRRNAR